LKVYLASSWRNPQQPAFVAAIREAGHECYDFRNPAPGRNGFAWREIEPEWQEWDAPRFRMALRHLIAVEGFDLDMNALRWCDACVLLLPCGRTAHLEAGWAVGAGKRVYVVLAGQNEPELMYRMTTGLCLDLDELLMSLAEGDQDEHEAVTREDMMMEETSNCPQCGYPDLAEGGPYKGIYTPGERCTFCGYLDGERVADASA